MFFCPNYVRLKKKSNGNLMTFTRKLNEKFNIFTEITFLS